MSKDWKTTLTLDGGDLIEHQVQDAEELLERNAVLRGIDQRSEFMRHIGSINNVTYLDWWREECKRRGRDINIYGPEMDEVVHKKLRDADYYKFRTDKAGTKWR